MAVTLTTSGSINTTIDDYGIAILSTTSSVNVGAISLVINVPNGFNVKNVKFPFANSSGSFNQLNGRLYVAGFDLVGTQINTNDVVLEITASGLLTGSFSLDTEYDWNNQFASSSAEAYENYSIRMPELLNPSAILSNQTGFTIGVNTRATNVGSFAGGVGTLASGYAAHAFGVNTTASGYAAFSTGVETDADGTGSFSMGSGSWARGTATVTMGIGTVASSSGQLVVGHYNETKTDINNIFVVGDGTGPLTANRRNIIEVYGGIGASFRGVKIDTAATPANTTTINGFNVYGRSVFHGGVTQSAGIITIDNDFGGGTHNSASYIAETYTSLGQLRGRTLLNYKGIDFNNSFLTSAPSSTHLWTNNANRLFYGSDAIILNGGNTLGGAMTIGTNDNNSLGLETNGSTRLFVGSSGNVGIGNTSPAAKLDVYGGDIYIDYDRRLGGGTAYNSVWNRILMYNGGSGDMEITMHNVNWYLRHNANATFAGNVGIGITSPGARLQVRGSGATSATTALRVENSAATERLTILDDGTSAFNTSHLYISSSGNVGIGTSTPTQKLHILNGNILLTDSYHIDWSNGSERIRGGGSGTGYSLQFSTYNGANLTEKMRISGSGEVGIGVTAPTARLHVSGASNSGLLEIDSPAQNNIIYVSGSGNVGIGTGTPTNTLQVVGGVTATSFTGSLFGTSSWAQNALTSSFITPTGTNAFVQGGNSFGTTALLGTNDNNSLGLETNGSTRLFVSSSGNVGIGTITPNSNLEIRTSNTVGSSSMLLLARALGYGHTLFEQTYDNTYFSGGKTLTLKNDSGVAFAHFAGNNAGSQTNVLIPTGNLGVGTTSPSAQLHVKGSGATSATTALRVENSNASASLTILDDGVWNFSQTGTVPAIRFGNQGTNSPVLAPYTTGVSSFNQSGRNLAFYSYNTSGDLQNGSFGFAGEIINKTSGTTIQIYSFRRFTPSSGTATFTNFQINTIISQSGGANGQTYGIVINPTLTSAADWRSIQWQNNAGFGLYGAGTANNYLAGNLGIGTTTPLARLDVSGSGAGSEVFLVSPSGAPTVGIKADSTLTDYSGLYIGNKHILRSKNSTTVFFNIQDGLTYVNGNSARTTMNSAGSLGLGITSIGDINSRLHVRGTGATSATTALRVENSNASASLVVRDDGAILIGTANTQAPFIAGSTGTSIFGSSQRALGFVWNGGAGNRPNPSFYFTSLTDINWTTNTGEILTIGVNFNPTSGTGVLNTSVITPTINQTGGANGITRGLYVNPILTAASDWRSIEWSNNTGFGLYGAGTANNYLAGNLGIGTITPTAKFTLSGSNNQELLRVSSDSSSSIFLITGSRVAFGTDRTNRGYTTFFGPATNPYTDGNGQLAIISDVGSSVSSSGYGGTIVFGGSISSTDSNRTFASIVGFKENDTNNNRAGYLGFGTRAGTSPQEIYERMRITSTGNVGIGTTSPSAQLHISGASNSGLLEIDSPAQNNIIYVSGSGNVGIGTSNPTEKLYVDGNVIVTGRITAEEFHTEFVSASIVYKSGSTQFGNSLDDIHTFTGSINTTGSLSLKGPLYDNLGTAGTPDQVLFTTSTGVEWRDNIAQSAQDLVVTGKNVGVSTIEKGTPLYFTSSGTSGNIVGILPADAGNPDRMPAAGVAGEQITAGNEGDVYIYGFISGVNTSAFNSGDDVFVAVGGGYTNVKPTGSALIQKLGNVEKVDASNGSGVIQGPSWYNDLPNWEIGRVMVGRSNGQPVTSSLVYLDESNGRLGLGTTTPSTLLHVSGTIANPIIVERSSTTSNVYIQYKNATTSWYAGQTDQNTFGIGTNAALGASTIFNISSSGNVGIGTTNPLALLHISQPSANTIFRLGNNTTYDQFIYFNGNNDWSLGMDYSNSNAFVLSNSSTIGTNDRIVVTTAGNVGIGESSPSAKLEIKGSGATSATTALRVENSSGTPALIVQDDGRTFVGEDYTFTSSQKYYLLEASADGLVSFTNNTTTVGQANGFFTGELYLNGTQPFINHRAINVITTNRNTSTSNILRAFYASGRTGNSGAANTVAGFLGGVNIEGSGNVTNAIGLEIELYSQTNNKTITNMYGVKVQPLINSVGTITNTYGLYIDSLTAGTQSNAAYGIYQAGTDKNYFAGNLGIKTTSPSASLHISGASNSGLLEIDSPAQNNIIYVSGSGNVGIGTGTPSAKLHVDGDTILSGSLYTYGANSDIDSGSLRTVLSVSTGSYRAAFFDYVLNKSTNARAGTVFSVWNGTSVEYTETSTTDIGNTSDVNLSVNLSGGNIVLYASSSTNDWSMKALARLL